ncbi:MAG: sensor histidine kinase [Methylocapsa sp.]|nr:sensor histidine kinase [Methylocapsa sp.]
MARRLFLSALFLSVSILMAAGIVLSAVYRRTAEANFDERLGVYLRALIADIATPGETSATTPGQLGEPHFEIPFSGWYWQISRLDTKTQQIRNSRSLFASQLPRLSAEGVPAGIGGARKGYATGPDERKLRIVERIIDTEDQGIYLVQVAATVEGLEADIAGFERRLVVTFAVLALALVLSSAAQLRYGLMPLRRLQAGVAAIRRGEAEGIEGIFPPDIKPLSDELNLLIAANREVVKHARVQVGNLAHALKTPLSVLLNEASAEPASPLGAKVEKQAALMQEQISFYLKRARAAVRARTPGHATDVGQAVEALVRTFEKIYAGRNVRFSAAVMAPIRFQGERQDLDEMAGNLIDNAGKWASSRVAITAEPEPSSESIERRYFRLIIEDDGPGLDPDSRQAALARGKRLDETKPGSGLGLSIVADLAPLYGGELALDASPRGGLRAVLRLPAI